MIVEFTDTTVSAISKALVSIREEGGAVALGRVLNLVIVTEIGLEETAIEAANDASREHPMRVIVVATPTDTPDSRTASRIDAQIRVGGDAGAGEVIVLYAHGEQALGEESLIMGLLLPDTPVVAWWPGRTPPDVSRSAIGRIAQRRITDAAAKADPQAYVRSLRHTYSPGDTDFAWTRLTLWRAQLAAVLDQPPYEPVTAATVRGSAGSASMLLLAAWLQHQLQVEVDVQVTKTHDFGIHGVTLSRASGDITLERTTAPVATLTQPGQPVHDISLPRRSLRECLAEDLRRLDPDDLFGSVIEHGVPELDATGRTTRVDDSSPVAARS